MKIKNCPHCGKEPAFSVHRCGLTGNGFAQIRCCAVMEECFILDCYKPKKHDSEKVAIKLLIEKWNKRLCS